MTNYITKLTHYLKQSHTNISAVAIPMKRKTNSPTASIDNGAHGTEKLLFNTQVTEDVA